MTKENEGIWKEGHRRFLDDSRRFIIRCSNLVKSNSSLSTLSGELHSLKSLALVFQHQLLFSCFHHLEDQLSADHGASSAEIEKSLVAIDGILDQIEGQGFNHPSSNSTGFEERKERSVSSHEEHFVPLPEHFSGYRISVFFHLGERLPIARVTVLLKFLEREGVVHQIIPSLNEMRDQKQLSSAEIHFSGSANPEHIRLLCLRAGLTSPRILRIERDQRFQGQETPALKRWLIMQRCFALLRYGRALDGGGEQGSSELIALRSRLETALELSRPAVEMGYRTGGLANMLDRYLSNLPGSAGAHWAVHADIADVPLDASLAYELHAILAHLINNSVSHASAAKAGDGGQIYLTLSVTSGPQPSFSRYRLRYADSGPWYHGQASADSPVGADSVDPSESAHVAETRPTNTILAGRSRGLKQIDQIARRLGARVHDPRNRPGPFELLWTSELFELPCLLFHLFSGELGAVLSTSVCAISPAVSQRFVQDDNGAWYYHLHEEVYPLSQTPADRNGQGSMIVIHEPFSPKRILWIRDVIGEEQVFLNCESRLGMWGAEAVLMLH